MSTVSVCQFETVEKSYRSGWTYQRQTVLREVSFEVAPGETLALLGHNGAGKTTSIKALLGLIGIEGGRIRVFGQAPGSREALSRLGYLPENPYFYDHLSGREFLGLVADLHGLDSEVRRRRVEECLKLVGMRGDADRRLRGYSKGMLQRMGLAQALMNDPELLILDEPMGGLDPVGRHQIRAILGELKSRGKTIVVSSHILSDVESIADRAVILRGGEVVREVDLTEASTRNRGWQVQFRGLPDGGRGELEAQGYAIAHEGDGLAVEVDDADHLADAIRAVHATGAHLLRVQPKRVGLESIFVETVHSDAERSSEVHTAEEVGRILDSLSRSASTSATPSPENDRTEAEQPSQEVRS